MMVMQCFTIPKGINYNDEITYSSLKREELFWCDFPCQSLAEGHLSRAVLVLKAT